LHITVDRCELKDLRFDVKTRILRRFLDSPF